MTFELGSLAGDGGSSELAPGFAFVKARQLLVQIANCRVGSLCRHSPALAGALQVKCALTLDAHCLSSRFAA